MRKSTDANAGRGNRAFVWIDLEAAKRGEEAINDA